MEFGGRYRVSATRMKVWAALNDTSVLKNAIPGCHRIEWADQDQLDLEIKVNLGVVQPVFAGDLWLSGIVPAERYTLSGRGRGGLFGKAEGSADIVLEDIGEDTLLMFTANGGASGQVMKLGKAIVGKSAQKVIDGFFEHFGDAMGANVEPLGPPRDP
ncbi:hypothetical protein GCM10007989_30190 [Devosia pacifica]|uniref:Carbon monoxide dehydrogenase n=2 Tax=Devosia pacifica TaxID=1335967 RepID=A0A918SB67_9HYPH|nr:hypothetical protein GCM10007989_30190 [Devosia pacifica]